MRIQILLIVVALHVTNPAMGVRFYKPARKFKTMLKTFSGKSIKAIAKYQKGNFVYAPIGPTMLLATMAFGARNPTESQMRAALKLPVDDAENRREMKTILSDAKRTLDYELYLADKIFYNDKYRIKPEFLNITRSVFICPPQELDLSNYDSADHDINVWSMDETNRHITEVFDSWVIKDDTKILLASVAYFKGKWAVPFELDQTMPRAFYFNRTSAQNVETMFVSGYFRSGPLDVVNASFVELPYKVRKGSDRLSMYVIRPNSRNGIEELLRNFHKIDEFMLMLGTSQELNVYLPKFSFEGTIDLDKPFQSLGVPKLYSPETNFGGIVDEHPFNVENFVQKSAMDISEGGNPNAVELHPLHHQMKLKEFLVNRPFICVIMKENGIPIMIAVVKDPLQNNNPDPWRLSEDQSRK